MQTARIRAVVVDKQSCLSSGRCVAAEPGAFRFDGDRLAETTPAVLELPQARLEAVAGACPGLAIALSREDRSE
jgi:ferredoxin